jgi:four helix bundle protein
LTFPDFEKYGLGSQLRKASNSAPANLAETWNNKHINIYLEGINRAQGEIQETKHHITMAFIKNYTTEEKYNYFMKEYNDCGKMLTGLRNSLNRYSI